MIPTTIITSSKGRLTHLKQSLPTWLEHTAAEILVVSQRCPDDSGAWARGLGNSRVQVAEATEVRPGCFNKATCLNRGAALARGNFLLFLDADTCLTPGGGAWLEAPSASTMYVVPPAPETRDLTGVLGVWREDLIAVGGYDEGMLGWGSEDLELRLRLYLARRLAVEALPPSLFSSITHDDALRTRFYDEKNKLLSHRRNLQRLVDTAERLTRRSIFELMRDPVVRTLFGNGMGPADAHEA